MRVTAVDAEADVVSLATSLLANAPHGPRLELRRGPLAVADRYRLVRGSLNAAFAAAAVLPAVRRGGTVPSRSAHDRQAAGASAEAASGVPRGIPGLADAGECPDAW